MLESALATERLGRRYGRRTGWALRGVTINIPVGSVTALVGPNGAGKTTLIRTWIGFERPDEGRALVGDLDVRRDRKGAVRLLGYVPQANALYRDMTVGDHFRFAKVYRPTFDHASALQRVAAVGVPVQRRIGDLSGGEQAQVALAIALAVRARILLLDEPLSSLDPMSRREFLDVLSREVRETGATALLSSHIVTDIEQVCDRLAILARGRLVYDDSIAQATATHRTVPVVPELARDRVVGSFPGPGGELTLLRDSPETDASNGQSTLEEIVLGYLAAARQEVH